MRKPRLLSYFSVLPSELARLFTRECPLIRLDWEHVVTPVVNYMLTHPEANPDRLILEGRSLGGYLAPRAAAFEHRLAACIAVDGLCSFLPAEYIKGLERSEEHIEQEMQQSLNRRWALSQEMWTMQAHSLLDCIQKMAQYTRVEVAEDITCPILVCNAASDHFFAGQPQKLYDALTARKCICSLLRMMPRKNTAMKERRFCLINVCLIG
jgi:dienelactone hydrolase